MADVEPLRALHYDLDRTGGLQDVVAPPYDVIDADQRADLEASSPYNVVRIDLPIGIHPYDNAARLLVGVARRGRDHPRRAAGAMAARAAIHRPRRADPHADRVPRARARGGLRAGPDPPPRAHPPRSEGGPAAAHPRDQGQPVADLLAVRRSRRRRHRRPRQGDVRQPTLGRVHRRRRDRQPPLADRGPGHDRRDPRGPRNLRAADRRRPPPLRDRARVRGGDRRRGPPPLRADVPGRARGSRADRVPDPPPAPRPAPRPAGDARERHQTGLRHQATRQHRRARPGVRAAGQSRLHRRPFPPAVDAHAQGPGDRRRRALPITRRRTAGSTPPCSRR